MRATPVGTLTVHDRAAPGSFAPHAQVNGAKKSGSGFEGQLGIRPVISAPH